jgi:hypothetical protein
MQQKTSTLTNYSDYLITSLLSHTPIRNSSSTCEEPELSQEGHKGDQKDTIILNCSEMDVWNLAKEVLVLSPNYSLN